MYQLGSHQILRAVSPLRKHCLAAHGISFHSMVFSKIIGVENLTVRDRLLRGKLPEPQRLRSSSSRWSMFIHMPMKAMLDTRSSVLKTLSSGSHCKRLSVVFSFCIIPPMQVSGSSYRVLLMICLRLTTHH